MSSRLARVVHRPTGPSHLRLDVTVRRDGLYLAVRGNLDIAANARLRRALTLVERSPRGGSVDLGGVDHATPAGLLPLRDVARDDGTRIVLTALSDAVVDVAAGLGLATTTPLRLAEWRNP